MNSRPALVALLNDPRPTQVASALLGAAKAAQWLGAEVVLTGIRSEVARTLVTIGADLGGVVTRRTLQAGIEYATRRR